VEFSVRTNRRWNFWLTTAGTVDNSVFHIIAIPTAGSYGESPVIACFIAGYNGWFILPLTNGRRSLLSLPVSLCVAHWMIIWRC
jgi:hypothetical protein